MDTDWPVENSMWKTAIIILLLHWQQTALAISRFIYTTILSLNLSVGWKDNVINLVIVVLYISASNNGQYYKPDILFLISIFEFGLFNEAKSTGDWNDSIDYDSVPKKAKKYF